MSPQKFTLLLLALCLGTLSFAQTLSIEERNERIRQRWNRSLVDNENYVFNKEANNLLVSITQGLDPGNALVVAMGQGRNALFLARNGWEVTGFDLADKAVAYAEEQAEKEGLELNTKIESFDTFDFGNKQWDLITWLYGGCLGVEN
ncbi:MAG: class I SAM-dependent methyltransferase, partial [Eudoraea sp.]|nr:class I SAM-dependent methyltransferase [Eudoraea sp.]